MSPHLGIAAVSVAYSHPGRTSDDTAGRHTWKLWALMRWRSRSSLSMACSSMSWQMSSTLAKMSQSRRPRCSSSADRKPSPSTSSCAARRPIDCQLQMAEEHERAALQLQRTYPQMTCQAMPARLAR